jgi:hypothetical protein
LITKATAVDLPPIGNAVLDSKTISGYGESSASLQELAKKSVKRNIYISSFFIQIYGSRTES